MDPRIFTEGGISAELEDFAGDEWKNDGKPLPEFSDSQKLEIQKEFNLTDAELKELIETGSVQHGVIVCLACQDSGASDEDEYGDA